MSKLIAAIAAVLVATAVLVIAFGPSLGYWPRDSNNLPLQPVE